LGLVAAGARLLEVAPLNAQSSLMLLEHHVGPERIAVERGQAEALIQLCGGLPLALVVAAALTAVHPSRSLARTVDELRDERRRLEALSLDSDLSVQSTFDVSYEGLSVPARGTYEALGIHPGSNFGTEVVAAAIDADAIRARRRLNELLDGSLLTEVTEDYFQVHDLVRAHARYRARHAETQDQTMILRRMLEWYLWVGQAADQIVLPGRRARPYTFQSNTAGFVAPRDIADYSGALGWFERERHTLAAAIRQAADNGWFPLACGLANAMQPLFIVNKHYRSEVEVGEIALQAATAWGDTDAENNMRKRLPIAYTRLGEWDAAERHVRDMLRLSLARQDRRGEADAHYAQGVVFARESRFESAAAAFSENLAIFDELVSEPDRDRTRGIVLIELGDVQTELGQLDQAVARLSEARSVLSALRPPDAYNLARAEIALGHVQMRGGDDQTAVMTLQHALAMMTELGSTFEQARIHQALAQLARRTGDATEADRHTAISGQLLGDLSAETNSRDG